MQHQLWSVSLSGPLKDPLSYCILQTIKPLFETTLGCYYAPSKQVHIELSSKHVSDSHTQRQDKKPAIGEWGESRHDSACDNGFPPALYFL